MPNSSTTPLFQWISKKEESAENKPLKKHRMIILAVVGLIIVFSIIVKSYFLALFLVMFTVVIFLLQHSKPAEEEAIISEVGIKLGEKFYPFEKLEEFWIVYQPPRTKTLTLKLTRPFFNEITIQLNDQDPQAVREFLLRELKENSEIMEESLQETILEWLGI